MDDLPLLIDADEAAEYMKNHRCDDATKAYAIGVMSKDGYSNKKIREATGIDTVYTVTHYKRAGTKLSEDEIRLWHKNPKRITLGHVRVVARLPRFEREKLLRDLISKEIDGKPISVSTLKEIAKGKVPTKDSDIKSLENAMEEVLGRQLNIQFNKEKKTGSIKLSFFTLDDLERICNSLGYRSNEP